MAQQFENRHHFKKPCEDHIQILKKPYLPLEKVHNKGHAWVFVEGNINIDQWSNPKSRPSIQNLIPLLNDFLEDSKAMLLNLKTKHKIFNQGSSMLDLFVSSIPMTFIFNLY